MQQLTPKTPSGAVNTHTDLAAETAQLSWPGTSMGGAAQPLSVRGETATF